MSAEGARQAKKEKELAARLSEMSAGGARQLKLVITLAVSLLVGCRAETPYCTSVSAVPVCSLLSLCTCSASLAAHNLLMSSGMYSKFGYHGLSLNFHSENKDLTKGPLLLMLMHACVKLHFFLSKPCSARLSCCGPQALHEKVQGGLLPWE